MSRKWEKTWRRNQNRSVDGTHEKSSEISLDFRVLYILEIFPILLVLKYRNYIYRIFSYLIDNLISISWLYYIPSCIIYFGSYERKVFEVWDGFFYAIDYICCMKWIILFDKTINLWEILDSNLEVMYSIHIHYDIDLVSFWVQKKPHHDYSLSLFFRSRVSMPLYVWSPLPWTHVFWKLQDLK